MSESKTQQELDFERKHEQDLQRLRGASADQPKIKD